MLISRTVAQHPEGEVNGFGSEEVHPRGRESGSDRATRQDGGLRGVQGSSYMLEIMDLTQT